MQNTDLVSSHFVPFVKDDDDIFDAEEAAAYDAHDISDAGIESAAMERAVMMAYRMMANRRKSLKTQLDHVKCAEDEMVLLEKATEDLGKRYRENVRTSSF
jgi:hypothetical protein